MAVNAARTAPRKGAGRMLGIPLGAVLCVLAVAFIPTTILVVVGLAPTVAAFIFDQQPKRPTTLTVLFMNVAGIVPAVISLWEKGQTLDRSLAMVQDPMNWLIAYGAAGFGWLIYFSVPPIVQFILAQRALAHIEALEEQQAELRRLWGEEIRPPQSSP